MHSVSDGLFVEFFWGGWEGGLDLELGYKSEYFFGVVSDFEVAY